MNASQTRLVTVVALAAAINATYSVVHKRNPFRAFLASGVMLFMLVALAEAVPEIAEALAWLFLLSSFLLHGAGFIELLSSLATGKG